jgi:hypothetical protein
VAVVAFDWRFKLVDVVGNLEVATAKPIFP